MPKFFLYRIDIYRKGKAVEDYIECSNRINMVASPENNKVISFPDLLAKAYLAKPLAAFSKTFVRRSSTRFRFLLVPCRVFRPIYTYFKPNYLNFYSSLSYS